MALMTSCLTCNHVHHTIKGRLVHAQMGKVTGSDELQLPWPLQRVSVYNIKLLKTISFSLGLSVKVLGNRAQCGTCSGKYSSLTIGTANANFSLTATFIKFI